MSCGFMFLFCWLALSVVFIALGLLSGSKVITAIGTVMLLMMAMVSGVD